MSIAREAALAGEVPVGAVVVASGRRPDEVLARVGNRMVRERDATAHAELVALRQAIRVLVTRAPGEGGELEFERAEPEAAAVGAVRGGNGRGKARG